jgi:CheY-like chemotaxis protein
MFVLVVDDDRFTAALVRRFLPRSVRTALAANGRDALDTVMQDPPDAIVMDLDMPVMGGLEAAERIRAWEQRGARARCAMIAMSSHDDEGSRARCAAAGFDRFLAKPVSPETLRQALAGFPFAGGVMFVDPDLRQALPGFLASRREMVDALAQAVTAGSAEPARALAHKLAGSFALYGFLWAAEQGKMIEARARANALEGLAAEVAALRLHLEGVQAGLEGEKPPKEPQ